MMEISRTKSGKLACPGGDQPVDSSTGPIAKEWRTRELKDLEDAINSVLRAEGVLLEGANADAKESATGNGEPESEAPIAGEAVQAGIERLNLAVMRQVVKPLLECSSSTPDE